MRGLRLVLTTDDADAALRLYRDTLGMAEQARYSTDDGRVVILEAGVATMEVADPPYAAYVDAVEVGHRVAGQFRVALEVSDVPALTEAAVAAGARLVSPPVRTPWDSLNSRLDAPGGVHLTLYSSDVYVTGATPVTAASGTVELSDPDPAWASTGARLAAGVRAALGPVARLVEHVGSTSVPGLVAKPVIDLVLAVPDPADEQAYVPALESLGYTLHLREPEWHEHRLLKHTDPVTNLHVFGLGSVEVERMLAFRDHLRVDARDRRLYAETKRDLAARTWGRVQDYADAKTSVVRDIVARATGRPAPLRDVLVLVSGPPASGKTTLARDLAPALGLPLLAKDTVKEALFADRPVPDVAASRRLGSAAVSVVLALAAESGGAVLEGPWRRSRAAELAALPGRVVEVFCRVDRETADRHYAARPARHPSHHDTARTPDELWDDDITGPVGGPPVGGQPVGGWPVLEVDTARPVDVGLVVRQVRQLASSPARSISAP